MLAPRRTRWPAALLLLLAFFGGACSGRKTKTDPASAATSSALETYQKGMEFLTRRSLRQAREKLGQIEYQPGSTIRDQVEPLARIAMADATFYQGTPIGYIDSRNLYLDFVTQYGDHPLAPYAQTQVGLCSLKQVNHPTKDQSQTRQAINDLEDVLRRWPDSRFSQAALGLRRIARSSLAEAEYSIGRFYLKRKAWSAATGRFKRILQRYPDFLEVEKVQYHLGKALINSGNSVEGRLILDQLVTESPEGRYADPARKLLAKLDGGQRSSALGQLGGSG